jgi:hypothetical protein
LRKGPLFVAAAISLVFALLGGVLAGGSGVDWFAGFLGIVVFLVPLTALLLVLRRYERFSATLVAGYYVWVLYDLAWTYQLWRLNDVT